MSADLQLPVLIPLAALTAYFALLGVVVLRAPPTPLRLPFATYVACMVLWSLGSLMAHLDPPLLGSLWWLRIMGIGPSLATLAILWFVSSFSGLRLLGWQLGLASLAAATVLGMGFTSLVVSQAEVVEGRLLYRFGAAVPFLAVLFFGSLGASLYKLLKAYFASKDTEFRNRSRYVALGIAWVFFGSLTNFTYLGEYASDVAANLINALLLGYVVARHQLADIRFGLHKGFVLLVGALSIVTMYILAHTVLRALAHMPADQADFLAAVITAFIVALVFQPLHSRSRALATRLFLPREYGYATALWSASQEISRTLDLDKLLASLRSLIARTLEVRECDILLPTGEKERYWAGLHGEPGQAGQGPFFVPQESLLIRKLQAAGKPIPLDEVQTAPWYTALGRHEREMLEKRASGILVPVVSKGELVGVLALGPKLSGFSYSEEDKRFLHTMANTVAVAIDNARLYQEARDSYVSLQRAQQAMLQGERLRALGEVAAGVAHDFNNALTTILSRAQLGKEDCAEPHMKKTMEAIEQAALDAAQIVRRLRMLAQERTSEEASAISIDEVAHGAVALAEPRIRELRETKGVQLDLDLRVNSGGLVKSNASDLREVFTNLIFNALDAMPSGGKLSVRSRKQGGWVEVSFADTGMGISPENLSRIFDPFFTTKAGIGTGLGLSISQKIVAALNGSISVDSALGRGSTFTIRLPRCQRVPERTVESPRTVTQGRGLVLLVDDDLGALESLQQIAARAGFEAHVAKSGVEALKLLSRQSYDAVLADLGIGDIGGFQLAEQVKKRYAGTPLAIVTGWNVPLDRSEMERLGIVEVVQKPFPVDEIANLLSRLAARRELDGAASMAATYDRSGHG